MTDSKMPERIWVQENRYYGTLSASRDPVMEQANAPYIRADLAHPAPAPDAELEAFDLMVGYRALLLDHPDIQDCEMRLLATSDTFMFLDLLKEFTEYAERMETALRARTAPVADAELEALAETSVRNWLGEMEGFATRGERFFDSVQAGDDMMPWLIAAASSALRARTAQPVGVRVKPLDWTGEKDKSYRQANCILGQYQVAWLGEFECWQLSRPHVAGTEWKKNFTRHESRDEAMSAAQADYEQRILSALLPEGCA